MFFWFVEFQYWHSYHCINPRMIKRCNYMKGSHRIITGCDIHYLIHKCANYPVLCMRYVQGKLYSSMIINCTPIYGKSLIYLSYSLFFKKPSSISDKICGVYIRDENESHDIRCLSMFIIYQQSCLIWVKLSYGNTETGNMTVGTSQDLMSIILYLVVPNHRIVSSQICWAYFSVILPQNKVLCWDPETENY